MEVQKAKQKTKRSIVTFYQSILLIVFGLLLFAFDLPGGHWFVWLPVGCMITYGILLLAAWIG